MEPGILFTERQFGLLELHSADRSEIEEAGKAILDGIGASPKDQFAPSTLFVDIIENISDQHAIILNRSRAASILVPGTSLLLYELAPALFACAAANEAERAAPGAVINDVQMMGATGRVFLSGNVDDLERARAAIESALKRIDGRRPDGSRKIRSPPQRGKTPKG